MTLYQWIAVMNGCVWTLEGLGGLAFVAYALYLMIGDLQWANAQFFEEPGPETQYDVTNAKLDLLMGVVAAVSQVIVLGVGALFLGAVVEHPPDDPGNAIRAIVSPWGVMLIEASIVTIIWIWIKKRKISLERLNGSDETDGVAYPEEKIDGPTIKED